MLGVIPYWDSGRCQLQHGVVCTLVVLGNLPKAVLKPLLELD